MVEVGRKRKGVVQPEKGTEYEMRRNANILANEKRINNGGGVVQTEYEMQRNANILANEKRIQELNLQALSQEVNSPIKKKKKVAGHARVVGSKDVIGRNIRSSTRLNAARVGLQAGNANAEEPNSGAHDLQAGNANVEEPVEALHVQEKKKVRGPTKCTDIFARQNKPKLKVEINEYGQPCGDSSTKFANFIGALVRTKGFPLAADDWRKVEARHKYKLWTDAQLYWDIDRGVFSWFMATAATKWKEFKADLKKAFMKKYHDDMEEDELLALCDERVHDIDWKWLIDHWRSPEANARSLRGKSSRSNLTQNHTTGSKSHACLVSEMIKELGRLPRRDEVFIRGHTHKNGVPQKGSATTINELKDAVTNHPELKEKSIQEGDVFFHVCGPEKNGYVRCVGLGPTPADLEMPGTKKYTSTRLQMEIEARRHADQRVALLESRLDQAMQILEKLQQQVPSQNRNSTPHGSNNELLVNSRIRPSHADEELNDDEDDVGSYAGDEMEEEHLTDYEDMFMPRRVARPEEEQHAEGGRDVILYSVVRPYDVPVAKATVQTSNPSAVVGGTRLGVQYSEVVVNHVFAREAILPRPYGAVTTIGQAVGKCIAWPRDRMKDDKKSSRQLKP